MTCLGVQSETRSEQDYLFLGFLVCGQSGHHPQEDVEKMAIVLLLIKQI
jgi:hypothetical protein